MRRKAIVSSMLVVLGFAATATADSAASAPSAGSVYLANVTAAGTGCSPSSLATQLAGDLQSLDIELNNGFDAQVGPGIPVHEKRKNCDIAFTVHVPAGWSFALTEAEYQGYAQLDPNVTGVQSSTYWFANEGPVQTTSTQLGFDGGGYDDVYDRLDVIDQAQWSQCGVDRIANINMSVAVNNSKNTSGNGFLSLDYANVHVQGRAHWRLNWRPC
jgi:hypothetical protein